MTIGSMPRTRIGGTPVSRLALGGANWSLTDNPDVPAATATIHAAIDNGVTLIDTARAYTTVDHASHNEWLIGRALATHPDGARIFVATKGGHFRSGPTEFPVDTSPGALRRDCEQSLHFLHREPLDLFTLHRADHPSVVIEECVAELATLRAEGKIRYIGLSNVTPQQLDRARAITTIDAVQNRYSPLIRDDETLEYCAAAGIPYMAYSPLGGNDGVRRLGSELPALQAIADSRGLTVAQIVIAWLLARSPNLIPIVGTGRPEHLVQLTDAATVALTSDELRLLAA